MGPKSEDAYGKSPSADGIGVGKTGLSFWQWAVIAMVAYFLITTAFLGRTYRSKAFSVSQNPQIIFGLPSSGEESNALSQDPLIGAVDLGRADSDPAGEDGKNASSVVTPVSAATYDNETDDVIVGDLEENAVYEEWRASLYHSSVVFGLGFEEMLAKFKLYIYPREDHAFASFSKSRKQEATYADEMFADVLSKSSFTTVEPEEASLYFLPVSIRSLWNDRRVGPQRVGRILSKYVQGIREDLPYWQRTLGADHALVVCHDYKEDGSRNALELKKNVIQISCSPLAGAQTFYPHKDFAVPPVGDAGNFSSSMIQLESIERKNLLYHSGNDSGRLTQIWSEEKDVVLVDGKISLDVHRKYLADSKFCLILMPEDTEKVVDVLRAGCVPVLVSDGRMYDLPFQDVLDWTQFSVIVSSMKLKDLKSALLDFPCEQYRRKHILALDASRHMTWHNPPEYQDAFYMTLYDLWIRRHSIRYIERTDL